MILDRRNFLRMSATSGALLISGAASSAWSPVVAADPTDPFQHGVASGDPLPDGAIIWTRVTPTADSAPGSGTGPTVAVRWEVAEDADFRRIVQRGAVPTGPDRDHTIKVEVRGLKPATTYSYRFWLDDRSSSVGRTRTAPHRLDPVLGGLRFGVVSCANWEAGYFSAYRHLARLADHGHVGGQDLDAILHLGDYLYEYGQGYYNAGGAPVAGRLHDPEHEMVLLADYRRRHAQYKTDPDLQELHRKYPWIVTWDDHESANDSWRDGAENHDPHTEGAWAARKAAARQAYDEWMPVRFGPDGELYRSLRFGLLAEVAMLDLRSYRDEQTGSVDGPVPAPDPTDAGGVGDESRTITGPAQGEWLRQALVATGAQWKLIGNPVMVTPVVFPPLPADISRPLADLTGLVPPDGVPYNVDQWDGYQHDRQRLLHHLADHGVQDTVFLTGDIHSSWACDVPLDAGTYPLQRGRSVATELVGTSVTSDNLDDITGSPPRTASITVEQGIMTNNRHIKYLEFDSHGFSVLDVTPARVQMDWFFLADRTRPDSGAAYATSFVVPAGQQRVVAGEERIR